MKWSVAVVVVVLFLASSVSAQITTLKIGDVTYRYNSATGKVATVTQVGDFKYINSSDGTSGTQNKVGSYTYYSDNKGTSGTTSQVGSQNYHSYRTKKATVWGTSSRVGDYLYTNLYGSDGSSASATTNTIGSTTYTNYRVRTPSYKVPSYRVTVPSVQLPKTNSYGYKPYTYKSLLDD